MLCSHKIYRYQCAECGALSAKAESEEIARDLWNTRAPTRAGEALGRLRTFIMNRALAWDVRHRGDMMNEIDAEIARIIAGDGT